MSRELLILSNFERTLWVIKCTSLCLSVTLQCIFYNISVISVVNECCSKIEIATDENCGEEWVTCLKNFAEKTNQVI